MIQASQTSLETEPKEPQTPPTTARDAGTGAPELQLLFLSRRVQWERHYASSVTLTGKELFNICNSLSTLEEEYADSKDGDLGNTIVTVLLEALVAAHHFRSLVIPLPCRRFDK